MALAAPALAAEALPPTPDRWVTDGAGLLSAGARQALDRRLEAYERSTGHQVIVWISRTLGGQSLDDWAARTFAAWGVGRRKLDDGAALFVFAQDRLIRIEVGYGLEDRLTDVEAARIIRERMAPRLRGGDPEGAVTAAVDGMLAEIGGEAARPAPAPTAAPPGRGVDLGDLVMLVIALAIFAVLFITNPSLAVALLYTMASGGRGGGRRGFGGGGGGGGFSGGGGRSGGGGASGSW